MPLTPRAIVQCDRDGKDIRSFPSVIEACKELGITNKEHIYRSIKYGVVAFGYRWRYLDEPLAEMQGYNMRLKPVIATDRDGVDHEYKSIVDASSDLGVSVSHIQEAIITGGLAKGYRFRLLGADPKPKKNRHRNVVVALDDEGNIIKQWPSVYDAAENLGVIPSAIYWAINPKHKNAKCKGHRLRYKD